MNAKELETVVMGLKATIDEQSTLIEALKGAAEVTQGVVRDLDKVMHGLMGDRDGMQRRVHQCEQDYAEFRGGILADVMRDLTASVAARDEHGLKIAEHESRLADMESKVNATNKSAPSKRNMTDDDARRLMTGDLKDVDHKEAAETVGLTYAQVYSFRKEYTFKHVHKELRDAGVKNHWVK